MTCLDRLKQDHPEDIYKDSLISRCPSDYGYMEDPYECGMDALFRCEDCWNREMPEKGEA